MSLKVGVDSSKFPRATELGAIGVLQLAAEVGLEGVFFRSAFELSPKLDRAELADVVACACDLGMYLEAGVAKVNPFATPEAPEIRKYGDGDYLLGMERIIRALAEVGVREMWTATANYQFHIRGLRACDRFRTDVTWDEQLAATSKVLHRLAPILREVDAHLNIETHEEITSFEVVRLVEDAGPDAFGITFDTANVFVRCEDPGAAAARVAPYVRTSHVRDVAALFTPEGISRFLAPVGQGIIDWPTLLRELVNRAPQPTLSIEGIMGGYAEMPLYLGDPAWEAGHPDLVPEERASVMAMTRAYEERVSAGEVPGLAKLRGDITEQEQLAFITNSAARLRLELAAVASSLETPVGG